MAQKTAPPSLLNCDSFKGSSCSAHTKESQAEGDHIKFQQNSYVKPTTTRLKWRLKGFGKSVSVTLYQAKTESEGHSVLTYFLPFATKSSAFRVIRGWNCGIFLEITSEDSVSDDDGSLAVVASATFRSDYASEDSYNQHSHNRPSDHWINSGLFVVANCTEVTGACEIDTNTIELSRGLEGDQSANLSTVVTLCRRFGLSWLATGLASAFLTFSSSESPFRMAMRKSSWNQISTGDHIAAALQQHAVDRNQHTTWE